MFLQERTGPRQERSLTKRPLLIATMVHKSLKTPATEKTWSYQEQKRIKSTTAKYLAAEIDYTDSDTDNEDSEEMEAELWKLLKPRLLNLFCYYHFVIVL